MKSKNWKSSMVSEISYELLTNDYVMEVIFNLFMLCFGSHIISFVWRQVTLCLVLKDSNSDQRVPLNFWVISLLSTIYEMYRSIFNNRLISYLKDNDLLIDEQNGYRRERSCACYVFNSTVLYRIEKKHS